MNSAIPEELQSTLVELEDALRHRYSDIAANPLVYFLLTLDSNNQSSSMSGRGLFAYSGHVSRLANRTPSILRDPLTDKATLESALANLRRLQAHEEQLNSAIDTEAKSIPEGVKRQILLSLQSERRTKLEVIYSLLARVSPASQKVEDHYLKSVLFRKGAVGMQEVYTLMEQLTELTDARNEVFLRPSQAALENYLHHAELAPSRRDVRKLFNSNIGLTEADREVYIAGLEKLQDELHVAVLMSGV